MCKLLIVLGAKKPKEVQAFMGAMLTPMSRGNSDGAGYTAIRKDGSIFTERWKDNKLALKGDPKGAIENKIKDQFGPLVDVTKVDAEYSAQGNIMWGDVTSVIMHTRLATCDKTFANVHPFVDNDNLTAIAHNGVIRNHKDYKKLNSTCDSETVLTQYNKMEVGKTPSKAIEMIQDFEGYWAIGATTLDANGKRILDIFTSNTQPSSGSLCVAYIKELDGYVMASTATHIKEAITDLKWDKDFTTFDIQPHVFSRFDAVTGDRIQAIDFSKSMESEEVKKTNSYHTKTHSFSKKKKEQRRLLSQNSSTSTGNAGNSSGSSTSQHKSSGTIVCGCTGSTATFYDTRQNQTVSRPDKSGKGGVKGLSQAEKDALAHYEQSKMDEHPANYTSSYKKNTKGSSDFQNSLSNFLDSFGSSDSKYNSDVLDGELSDRELDELDQFEDKLDKYDAEILSALNPDMKYAFLQSMKKEA